ncbi:MULTISPECIES: succinylglutamate desuccinylase/aspartoacylase family protein [unclassified Rhizobium]|uniref:L,D-transpeptidase family protein n=1 Tax=unclassified Rhizobium TaxID=2613769 RepID=UPI0024793F10|nr:MULTISPECIES: succinylglutamate desuccinylase/aspartoacylase family protein [unclassified Rhizobium]MDH7801472.1 L,D-peptidoglycan transpeptidase YkuD (ErfK/YbiS/YcfS/YnhG family)/predicted deacylase [Rhizobium sp. AN70]
MTSASSHRRLPTVKVRVRRNSTELHHGTLSIDDWTVPCVVGRGGLITTSLKREGDGCTPIGVFPLRYGFFNSSRWAPPASGLSFPFVPMTDEMVWEEDPGSPTYNRLTITPGGAPDAERINRVRSEPLFDIVVPIGHNDASVEPHRGSAIFIHAARSDMSGTAGCVALWEDDLKRLVSLLVPGMVIDIDFDEPIDQQQSQPGPIEIYQFRSLRPGPRLLVLGAVHGNETCGPEAIREIIAECTGRKLKIERGLVTFVPVVNLKAFLKDTREGDRNFNRDLREVTVPKQYEDYVANQICAMMREHDVLLDLHSFRSQGSPFVFVGPRDNDGSIEPFARAAEEETFASVLGPDLILDGWLSTNVNGLARLSGRAGANPAEAALPLSSGVGTTEYMRFAGGYGVTLECGSHLDPQAPVVAANAIRRALAVLRLIDAPSPERTVKRAIELVDVVFARDQNDRLAAAWKTGDQVSAGDVIAYRASGEAIRAPDAGYIIFPDSAPEPGKELFYFGKASNRFS